MSSADAGGEGNGLRGERSVSSLRRGRSMDDSGGLIAGKASVLRPLSGGGGDMDDSGGW